MEVSAAERSKTEVGDGDADEASQLFSSDAELSSLSEMEGGTARERRGKLIDGGGQSVVEVPPQSVEVTSGL